MPYITNRQTGEIVYPSRGGWVCATVITTLDLPAFGSVANEVRIASVSSAVSSFNVSLPAGDYLAHATLEQGAKSIQSAPVAFTVR